MSWSQAPPHPALPGSFIDGIQSQNTLGPSARLRRDVSEEWEDEDGTGLGLDDVSSVKSAETSTAARRGNRGDEMRTPTKRGIRVKGSGRATPVSARSPKSPRASTNQRKSALASVEFTPFRTKMDKLSSTTFISTLGWSFSFMHEMTLAGIRLAHVLLTPIYPYLFLAILTLLAFSGLIYASLNVLPTLLFKVAGVLIRSVLPSWPTRAAWWTPSSDTDTALGQGLALLPLRTLATPACLLSGQMCALSLFTMTGNDGTLVHTARPFWSWSWTAEVDVGEVARSLTKEAKGARDIFESIAMLSEGGMMDRLEYVRIWELGAAVQIGSNLETRDIVSKNLYELGNVAKELSDQLVETNAMAVDAFTWLQWEFAALVKMLSLPSSSRPSAPVLSARLNQLLNRLSSTLTTLHKMASNAHVLANHGSTQGQTLRSHLNPVGADLRREHERAPGWRSAVDKAGHFLVGGDPSKSELIARDLRLTEYTIASLSDMVKDLEGSRSAIKGFRDQIGFFDASMMGFHLGAGEHVGIGAEEEVRVLNEVVEGFGKAVGRAKIRSIKGDVEEAEEEVRGIEG